jgi:hypothetical protein
VLKTEGLTQKYMLRTYDENILAPLVSLFGCFDIHESSANGEVAVLLRHSSGEIPSEVLTTMLLMVADRL